MNFNGEGGTVSQADVMSPFELGLGTGAILHLHALCKAEHRHELLEQKEEKGKHYG